MAFAYNTNPIIVCEALLDAIRQHSDHGRRRQLCSITRRAAHDKDELTALVVSYTSGRYEGILWYGL